MQRSEKTNKNPFNNNIGDCDNLNDNNSISCWTRVRDHKTPRIERFKGARNNRYSIEAITLL